MNQTALRVGVIGLGKMGQRHCRVYSTLRRSQLTAVCDIDRSLASAVAQQYGAEAFDSADALLEHVDGVSIATPTQLHFALASECLTRGVHALVEKPLTETVDQAQALCALAQSSRATIQVGHIERFNPTFLELKNTLESLGILAIEFRRLSPLAGSNVDVDVISDLMIHDLDLLHELLGEDPTSLAAHGLVVLGRGIDHASAQLGFAKGTLATLTASRVTEQKVRSVEVTARGAYVVADLLAKTISLHRHTSGEYLSQNHRGVKYRQEGIVERIHVPALEPLLAELQRFVDGILDGKASAVPAEDGLRALQWADRVRQSVQSHRLEPWASYPTD
ncbi:MAG: Gfo/Idh/MocA family oxidoreductase [Chloroflexi bacterium]|nr:Gfo/Idh/MocA family oxidoreductase [Chloroflexota bacterium]